MVDSVTDTPEIAGLEAPFAGARTVRWHQGDYPSADDFRVPPAFVDHPWKGSILYPWDLHKQRPWVELLRTLPPAEAFDVLWRLRTAEVDRDKGPLLEQLQAHIRLRVGRVPGLRGHDLDLLAARCARWMCMRDIHTTLLAVYGSDVITGLVPLIEWVGREVLDDALADGRGIVCLALHTHACETGATYLPQFFPVTGVISVASELRLPDPRMGEIVPLPEVEILLAPGPDVLVRSALALRRNRVVCFPAEYSLRTDDTLAAQRFMGLTVHAPIAPARLAARMEAPMAVFVCHPLSGGRVQMRIVGPMRVDDAASQAAAFQQMFDVLAAEIADEPHAWQGWFMLEQMLQGTDQGA